MMATVKKATREDWPVCMRCGCEVTTETGCLAINPNLATAKQRRLEEKFNAATDADGFMDMGAVNYDPAEAHEPWFWGHKKCSPDSEWYWIGAERIQTVDQALSWTLHLLEKNWFDHFAWERAVRRLFHVAAA